MSMPPKWLPSVEAIRDNIVFVRLTRHSRWPSLQTTMRLFGVAFLVGMGGAVILLFTDPAFHTDIGELVGTVIVVSGLAVAFLSPPVVAVITVIATVTNMRSEVHRLMQVSPLPREEIVSGYIYAALYRLRLLWVLAFGLLPPPVAVLLTGDILLDTYTGGIPIMVVLAAPVIWLIGVMEGVAVNWVAACIAVWQSLCRKRVGTAIITTLALLSATGGLLSCASCFALDWVANREVGDAAAALGCCLIHFLPIMGYAIPALTYAIRKEAKDCI
jgi:hypothetical protein